MPREVRYLTDRFGILELNGRKPLYQSHSLKVRTKDLLAELFPLLGKSKMSLFESRMQDLWWERIGKKGKPRGLVQGITREELDAALVEFKRSFQEDPKSASRELYFSLAQAQLNGKSVTYFADSTPINILNAHHIYKLFPKSKFINMVRDGRDTALSVTKEPWGPNDPMAALDWWKGRILAGHNALAQIPESAHMTLNLEDLVVHNRQESYQSLLTFLNLGPSATLEKYFQEKVEPAKMKTGSWRQEVKNAARFDAKYSKILRELADQGVEIKKFY
jgi:hypothetical protein